MAQDATMTPQELSIIIGHDGHKVLKISAQHPPFFVYNEGLYWFSDPVHIGHNMVHIYFEGISQPITDLVRRSAEEGDE